MPPLMRRRGDRMLGSGGVQLPPELSRSLSGSKISFPLDPDILRRIKASNPDLTITEELGDWMRDEDRFSSWLDAIREDDSYHDPRLLPHQEPGVLWLAAARRGILADAQGLGKTVTALCAAQELRPRWGVIICTNSKRYDWFEHAEEWTTQKPFHYAGSPTERAEVLDIWRRRGGWLVCNYSIAAMHADDIADGEVNAVIIDEAHNLRNRKTQQFKAIKRLIDGVTVRFLVTASPIINGPEDLWSLLHLLDPKRFTSFWSFAYRYCEIVEGYFGVDVGGLKGEEEPAFNRLLNRYVLRRGKEVLEGLPENRSRVVEYRMPPQQDLLYQSMLRTREATFGGDVVEGLVAVSQMTRLRQLALHPGLVFPEYDGPSKLDVLVQLILESEAKVVVFTNFAELCELGFKRLDDEGIRTSILHGGLSNSRRRGALRYFQKGGAQVLLATHKTGGEGLNLTEASRVIFLDLAWHPEGNRHARDRVDRHGQKADVVETIVIRTVDSVEEHVWDIIRQKRNVTLKELLERMEAEL